MQYAYGSNGRLETVTDVAGRDTRYVYEPAGGIRTITDARGIAYLTNEYDAPGRVVRQTQADGGVWTFAYEGPAGRHTRATATRPGGPAVAYGLSPRGAVSEAVDPLGQSTRYERDPAGRVTAITDALGRTQRFGYDGVGNVTEATDASGQTTRFTIRATAWAGTALLRWRSNWYTHIGNRSGRAGSPVIATGQGAQGRANMSRPVGECLT